MISKDELSNITIFKDFNDDMLENIARVTEIKSYVEGDLVFSEGDAARTFCILKSGKINLKKQVSDKISIFLGAIKPGFSFGWSSMLPGGTYTYDTICTEDCDVLAIDKEELNAVVAKDHSMGFLFMQRIMAIVKNRLDHRTTQLVRAIKNHPDMRSMFE